MADEIEWPREIWMAEREEHDQGVVSAVLSEHATIARFAGDAERDREFHRYVDADIYDSAEKYWKARKDTALAMVAAAYEEALSRARTAARMAMANDPCADELTCSICAGEIAKIGTTDADAQAALERVKREARNEAIADTLAALQRHSKDEWVKNLRVPHVKRMIALMEDTDDE